LPTDREKPFSNAYFFDVVRISRPVYIRVFSAVVAMGGTMAAVAMAIGSRGLAWVVVGAAAVGVLVLAGSLAGLYRFYGAYSRADHLRIIDVAALRGASSIAELHLGTYRHTRLLAKLLPRTTLHSIDCWHAGIDPEHGRLQQFREAERPLSYPNVVRYTAPNSPLPLPSASCDAVLLGIGFHEFPPDDRDRLLDEAARILVPRGKLVLVEHVRNLWSALVFGPEIGHWLRPQEWRAILEPRFGPVAHHQVSWGIDAFCGVGRPQGLSTGTAGGGGGASTAAGCTGSGSQEQILSG
jgi:SAM-dependent methyltransferase